MNNRRYVLAIVSSVLLCITAFTADVFSQTAKPRFVRYGIQDGLSDHTVTALFQDHRGFLWIGTSNGLNRFDGAGFTVYKHDPADSTSLSDSYVLSIFEDSEHTLWIGTREGGVNRYDGQTDSFTALKHVHGDENSIIGNTVWRVYKDSKKNIWIGTSDGLTKIANETGAYAHYRCDEKLVTTLSHNLIDAIHEDKNGILWLGTGDGLSRLDPETGIVTRFNPDPSKFPSYVVGSLLNVGNLLYLANWGGGLQVFDMETETYTVYIHDPDNPNSLIDNFVGHLAQAVDGTIWVGTGKGLCNFDPRTKRFTAYTHDNTDPTSISANGIWPLYVDRTGILWIGTVMGGLNKLAGNDAVFEHYPLGTGVLERLTDGTVNTFLEDSKGRIWIGTAHGIMLTDKTLKKSSVYSYEPWENSFDNNYIYTICEDSSGRIWFGGTRKGLLMYDAEADSIIMPPFEREDDNNFVLGINDTGKRRLWLNMQFGFCEYMIETGETRFHQSENSSFGREIDFITAMIDTDGNYWAGTRRGLVIVGADDSERIFFDGSGNTFEKTHHKILSVSRGPGDTVLVGTDKGLISYDMNAETFEKIILSESTDKDAITGVVTDFSGNIWLMTNTGLLRYSPENKALRTFSLADGLPFDQNKEHSLYCGKSGYIYVGGANGFYRFNPDNIKNNIVAPPVAITSFRRLNREEQLQTALDESGGLTLSHGDTFFSFGFAALDYTAPQKNIYAYKMEGFDSDWVNIGTEKTATYTNLDPGSYVFHVKAANSDGVWNEEGVSLAVTILPPFWGTWWFRILVAAAVVTAVLTVHRMRVKNITLQRERLRRLVDERTESLKKANEHLQELSITDDLTRLYNRRYFNRVLDHEWKRMYREKKTVSVIICDIDYFKNFNDHYGHLSGDHCLRTVASIIRRCAARPEDMVARYGGEEFIVVLPGTSPEGAHHLAEKMRAEVQNALIPHEFSDAADTVTMSFGVATANPYHGGEPKKLVEAADVALYKAKQDRNTVV